MIIRAITSSSASASVNPVRSLPVLKKPAKLNYTYGIPHTQVRTRAIHSTKLLSFLTCDTKAPLTKITRKGADRKGINVR